MKVILFLVIIHNSSQASPTKYPLSVGSDTRLRIGRQRDHYWSSNSDSNDDTMTEYDSILPMYGEEGINCWGSFDDILLGFLLIPYSLLCVQLHKDLLTYIYELIIYYWN